MAFSLCAEGFCVVAVCIIQQCKFNSVYLEHRNLGLFFPGFINAQDRHGGMAGLPE